MAHQSRFDRLLCPVGQRHAVSFLGVFVLHHGTQFGS